MTLEKDIAEERHQPALWARFHLELVLEIDDATIVEIRGWERRYVQLLHVIDAPAGLDRAPAYFRHRDAFPSGVRSRRCRVKRHDLDFARYIITSPPDARDEHAVVRSPTIKFTLRLRLPYEVRV